MDSMSMSEPIMMGLTSSTSSSVIDPSSNYPPSNSSDTTNLIPSIDTSSRNEAPLSHVEWIVVLILVALAFGSFLGLAVFLERRRQLARRVTITRRPRKPPSERYLEIEKWLVSKRVEVHDETCELACGMLQTKKDENRPRTLTESTSKTEGDHSSQSSDIEEGHRDECSICFEVFQPKEIVSWSPEPNCQHVFHHHCIKEWLLQKRECPFCREIFLPIDRIQGTTKLQTINELVLAQQRRSARCFYCIQHGVVRPSRGCRLKQCDVDAIVARSECVPTLYELQKIRGVADGEEYTGDSCHSAPSTIVLSSVAESSDTELCVETEGMVSVEDGVFSADSSADGQLPIQEVQGCK
ncbi:hypothetical protein FisN_28Lh003 [Fistulifera solaris]|uniref:RING-type domain-containing protein n=1 Tax=Fistulifera solaris TaxID=1519565 RepID=A0A1Z5KS76_FISSO|nr:hypothetical protein FisN_28Lh003 [Fistulifera solaris]|eukprot:GAX29174.1 hypothetical protein FisN_28Lh003 [Fistulifera solaris]